MPWCPECNTEYVENIKKCPECKVPLRAAPGLDELVFEDRTWTVIREVSNPMEAEIIKDVLEERGLEVMILGQERMLTYLIGVAAPGSTNRIMVPTESSYDAILALRGMKPWSEDELAKYMEQHGGMVGGDDKDYTEEGDESDKDEDV
jgi:hypothetical protein